MNPMWLLVLVAPAVIDTAVRAVLALAARRARRPAAEPAGVSRWLVLVSARSEGAAISPTLESVVADRGGRAVQIVVILDGPDPDAEAVCRRFGVTTRVKEPAGPSKATVLAWAARHLGAEIAAADAVLLLDVGSALEPGFFSAFEWPKGCSAAQAILVGTGMGAGDAAAHSEHTAQEWEDRGREALGWAVRLRGTGTVLTPDAFLLVAPRLRTRVEDHEASLLLGAAGRTLVLGPPGARVRDEKPASMLGAARQRARWLAGRVAIVVRQPGALARLVRRRPVEGLAFLIEIMSRPLSLTALARLALGAWLLGSAWAAGWVGTAVVAGAVVLASVAADAALVFLVGHVPFRGAARLVVAWLGAVTLLPKAFGHWLGGRRA